MPDRLANYVPVAERLTQAQEGIIAVEATDPTMLNDVMGYIRVAVYLSDGRKATGTASFRLDLTGKSAQATNPIEDCETSALGRALGMLGYSSNKSIASREEVREAQRRGGASYTPPASAPAEITISAAVADQEFKRSGAGEPLLKLTLESGQIALVRGADAETYREIAIGASVRLRGAMAQHKALGAYIEVRELRPIVRRMEEAELPEIIPAAA